MSSDRMNDAEKMFLAVVVFLVLKGLLDANDADDKERVRSVWKRVKGKGQAPSGLDLWDPGTKQHAHRR